jgi:molybdopterin molybdotransferase
MFTVKKRSEVLELLEDEFSSKVLEVEKIDILDALGRIISEDIVSSENVPEFRRSTVDGYSVKSKDTVGCSDSLPAFLSIAGETRMGEDTNLVLQSYEAIYVPTGGIIPEGADSVVMIEYTEKIDDEVTINRPVSVLENVVGIGDDVNKGEVVITKNTKIMTQHIGALAALGVSTINAYKKPKIGIISTGDELVPISSDIKIGQIRDVNTFSLSGMLSEAGCEIVHVERIKDDFDLIKNSLKKAVSECDIVLISGGSSVGNHDMTPEIINSLGDPGVLVHGIAIKPGKPTMVARINDTAVFGLPGHPASCIIANKVIVEDFINNTLLKSNNKNKKVIATSGFQVHVSSGRDVFYMVSLEDTDDGYIAHPIHGKSGMISLLSKADGYIEIPMEKEGIRKGTAVSVNLFR